LRREFLSRECERRSGSRSRFDGRPGDRDFFRRPRSFPFSFSFSFSFPFSFSFSRLRLRDDRRLDRRRRWFRDDSPIRRFDDEDSLDESLLFLRREFEILSAFEIDDKFFSTKIYFLRFFFHFVQNFSQIAIKLILKTMKNK